MLAARDIPAFLAFAREWRVELSWADNGNLVVDLDPSLTDAEVLIVVMRLHEFGVIKPVTAEHAARLIREWREQKGVLNGSGH